jgi:hypothetical protein
VKETDPSSTVTGRPAGHSWECGPDNPRRTPWPAAALASRDVLEQPRLDIWNERDPVVGDRPDSGARCAPKGSLALAASLPATSARDLSPTDVYWGGSVAHAFRAANANRRHRIRERLSRRSQPIRSSPPSAFHIACAARSSASACSPLIPPRCATPPLHA